MRGSDVVDLVLEIAPRWLVRAALLTLVAVVAVTGNVAPIIWYAQDKAAGITEAAFGPLVETITTPPSTQPEA